MKKIEQIVKQNTGPGDAPKEQLKNQYVITRKPLSNIERPKGKEGNENSEVQQQWLATSKKLARDLQSNNQIHSVLDPKQGGVNILRPLEQIKGAQGKNESKLIDKSLREEQEQLDIMQKFEHARKMSLEAEKQMRIQNEALEKRAAEQEQEENQIKQEQELAKLELKKQSRLKQIEMQQKLRERNSQVYSKVQSLTAAQSSYNFRRVLIEREKENDQIIEEFEDNQPKLASMVRKRAKSELQKAPKLQFQYNFRKLNFLPKVINLVEEKENVQTESGQQQSTLQKLGENTSIGERCAKRNETIVNQSEQFSEVGRKTSKLWEEQFCDQEENFEKQEQKVEIAKEVEKKKEEIEPPNVSTVKKLMHTFQNAQKMIDIQDPEVVKQIQTVVGEWRLILAQVSRLFAKRSQTRLTARSSSSLAHRLCRSTLVNLRV